MAEIKISIDKNTWQIIVEAHGYTGGKCMVDTDELQRILSMETETQKIKPEYARRVTTQKA